MFRYFTLIVSLLFFLVQPATAEESYPHLIDSSDSFLQSQLESELQQLGLSGAAARGELSLTLVDITDLSHPRMAAINGESMMYAASLPKIAILLGVFSSIERGEMELNDEVREKLVNMIRFSSNSAATEMLNRVGKENLAGILQSPRFALYDAKLGGGLWVGKDYGKAAAWKRDPLHNLSHGANTLQVARLYYLLETGQLFSPELSQEMKTILSKPGINHKFVKGLNQSRPGSDIYRKSGSWRSWHADSAIIERDGRRYIAVALAHSARGGAWLQKIIVTMDDLVFQTAPVQVALLD